MISRWVVKNERRPTCVGVEYLHAGRDRFIVRRIMPADISRRVVFRDDRPQLHAVRVDPERVKREIERRRLRGINRLRLTRHRIPLHIDELHIQLDGKAAALREVNKIDARDLSTRHAE